MHRPNQDLQNLKFSCLYLFPFSHKVVKNFWLCVFSGGGCHHANQNILFKIKCHYICSLFQVFSRHETPRWANLWDELNARVVLQSSEVEVTDQLLGLEHPALRSAFLAPRRLEGKQAMDQKNRLKHRTDQWFKKR